MTKYGMSPLAMGFGADTASSPSTPDPASFLSTIGTTFETGALSLANSGVGVLTNDVTSIINGGTGTSVNNSTTPAQSPAIMGPSPTPAAPAPAKKDNTLLYTGIAAAALFFLMKK